MEILTVKDVKDIFKEIGTLMEQHKEYLCQLDGALGDGDIGITMNTGFSSVNASLENEDSTDLGELFVTAGTVMSDKAPSTMGTLLAFGFLRVGQTLNGVKHLDGKNIVVLFEGIANEIMLRGKAKVGDKTILDSLVPGLEAFQREIEKDEQNLLAAITIAYETSNKGMEETVHMQSNKGRAARYLENSVGKQDPGATVGKLIFEGFYETIRSKSNA